MGDIEIPAFSSNCDINNPETTCDEQELKMVQSIKKSRERKAAKGRKNKQSDKKKGSMESFITKRLQRTIGKKEGDYGDYGYTGQEFHDEKAKLVEKLQRKLHIMKQFPKDEL